MPANTAQILKALDLEATNSGIWSPSLGWSGEGKTFESMNPATGEPIAKIRGASPGEYEQLMKDAEAAALAWREVPAPQRGEAVR
ncbi:MAG: aldehyde dehydrogenase family protein, partial [Gammaproteobacteria bacterium]